VVATATDPSLPADGQSRLVHALANLGITRKQLARALAAAAA